MKKFRFLAFLTLFALFTLFASFNSQAFSASKNIDSQIKNQQKNKKDIDKKIQQYNSIIKQKSKQSQSLLTKLGTLKKNANDSKAKIDLLENETSKLQVSIDSLNKNLESINKDIKIISSMLRSRLTDMYKYSPPDNSLNLLLTSENPHEVLTTAYMLNRFAAHDRVILDELYEKYNQIQNLKNQLESNKKQIQTQSSELKRKRAEFDNTIKQTDALLKDVQSEQKKAENAAKELVAAQREVGNKINALMKQKKASQNRAQTKIVMDGSKVTKSNTKNTKAQAKTQNNNRVVQASYSGNAPKSLSWPINGKISVPYGSRVHPTFKTKIFNSGIDIAAPSGTPVKASGAGEVLYQGWLRGFGQVVIIDHGGDLSTVYAHLSSTSVREGSVVNTGTIIGRVGNSGTDSAYGLHFEVRKNGSAQNPLNFLRK